MSNLPPSNFNDENEDSDDVSEAKMIAAMEAEEEKAIDRKLVRLGIPQDEIKVLFPDLAAKRTFMKERAILSKDRSLNHLEEDEGDLPEDSSVELSAEDRDRIKELEKPKKGKKKKTSSKAVGSSKKEKDSWEESQKHLPPEERVSPKDFQKFMEELGEGED